MKYAQSILGVVGLCALLAVTPCYADSPRAQQIPAGTVISVRMIDSISSDQNQAGQTFRASLAAPLRIGNRTVLPKGANASVKLVKAESAGRLKGRSELMLQLDRVGPYAIRSNVVEFRGRSQGKKTAKSAGIGAAIGGGVGAVLGGGTGAAIGGGLGAGAGVGSRALKEKKPIRLNSESLVSFRLASPIQIR